MGWNSVSRIGGFIFRSYVKYVPVDGFASSCWFRSLQYEVVYTHRLAR